jgi:hypothetical protein
MCCIYFHVVLRQYVPDILTFPLRLDMSELLSAREMKPVPLGEHSWINVLLGLSLLFHICVLRNR